jgi:hypothetical protein
VDDNQDPNQDPKDPLETLKNIEEGKKPDDPGEPRFYKYVSRPDAELKQIAADIYHDKVFTDRFIHFPAEIPMVFMPIMFMDREAQVDFAEDLGMIFEYYSEAGPRGYNGYPIFLSLQRLDKRDSDRLIGFYDEYKAMQEKIKKEWGEQDISGLNNIPVNPEDYDDADNY